MLLSAADSLLLIVDIQARLLPVMKDGDRVVGNTVRLLQAAGALAVPVLLTEQYPEGLGATVPAVRAAAGEAPALAKKDFSGYADPAIRARIADCGRPQVVIAGIEAHVCVLQTALQLAAAHYRVAVVADAVSSRHADSIAVAGRRMAAAGITLATTEMCLFEWLGTAAHPEFRAISRLIK
ncbi:isochorismatase family protein [Ferrovibrio sp.]|uniref:isochorismatase family protein n=1 Tax=Ferrovibrio sp. TaxID=1917215 RepID=UPI00311F48B4